MMRLRIMAFGMMALLALGSALPIAAQAADGIPLVVLRFNQPRVYFDKPLYNAMTQAVKIKPTLTLDVVSYVPTTGRKDLDAQYAKQANAQAASVLRSLQKMGIPKSRIRVMKEPDRSLRFHELHVYVQ